MEVPLSAEFGAFTPVERLVSGPAKPALEDLAAQWVLRWDSAGLHGRIKVTDAVLRNQDGRPHHNDGVEIYLDPDDAKTLLYQADDLRIRIIRGGSVSVERGTVPDGFSATQRESTDGYSVDFTLPLDESTSPGAFIGIDVHVVDNDGDRREHKIGWAAEDDNAYRSPASLGTVRLGG
jgi:endo-1,4-beta-xylanase